VQFSKARREQRAEVHVSAYGMHLERLTNLRHPTLQHNPTDTSGVVIAPKIVTGPDADTDYVCCAFNATGLVPDFEQRFPGGVKGRVDTAPADNMTACVDICASLYFYGCRAASWNSGQNVGGRESFSRRCLLVLLPSHTLSNTVDTVNAVDSNAI
jgi:hypothetical protein